MAWRLLEALILQGLVSEAGSEEPPGPSALLPADRELALMPENYNPKPTFLYSKRALPCP